MNSEEARFILSAYRPGGHDATNADFREALDQVEGDPDLRDWFAAEREFDGEMARHVRNVRPPADLKSHILAGGRASQPKRWSWFPRLAVAAVLLLCATVAGLYFANDTRTPPLAAWQEKALDFLESDPVLDLESPNPEALMEHLAAANSPVVEDLPAGLEGLVSAGCKQLDADGRKVSIVCFMGKDGELVHLVIADRRDAAEYGPEGPVFEKHDGWATATWAEGDRTVMLVRHGGLDEVKRLLGKAPAPAQAVG